MTRRIYVIKNFFNKSPHELESYGLIEQDGPIAIAEDESGKQHKFRGNDWWYDRKLAINELRARRRKKIDRLYRSIELLEKIRIK